MERYSNCFYKCHSCKNINLVPESWGGQLVDFYVYTNKSTSNVEVTLYSTENAEIFINDITTGQYATSVGTTIQVPSNGVIKVKNQNKGNENFPLINCSSEYGGCIELTKVNRYGKLPNAFYQSNAIGYIEDSAFSEVTPSDTSYMFYECSYLTKIPSNFNFIRNVTNTEKMFFGCSLLESIPYIDLPNLVNALSMFENCSKLISIGYSINAPMLSISKRMFKNCTDLTEIPFSFDTLSSLQDAEEMFYGCSSLTRCSNTWLGIGNASNVKRIFGNCESLTTIPTSWNGLKAISLEEMFIGCESLSTIPTKWEGLENAISIKGIFKNCGITYIPNSWLGLTRLQNMDEAFYGCSYLSNGGVSDFGTLVSVESCARTFYSCDASDINVFETFAQIYRNFPEAGLDCFKDCNNEDIDKVVTYWGGTLDVNELTEYECLGSNTVAYLHSSTPFSWYEGNIYKGEAEEVSSNWYRVSNVIFRNRNKIQTKGQTTRYVNETYSEGSTSNAFVLGNQVTLTGNEEIRVNRLGTELSLDIRGAFSFCGYIKQFDFSLLSNSARQDAVSFAFYNCGNFKNVSFVGMPSCIKTCESTFELSGVDSISFNGLEYVTNCLRLFANCTDLINITQKIGHIGTSSNEDVSIRKMFFECSNLESVGGMEQAFWYDTFVAKRKTLNSKELFYRCGKLYRGINPHVSGETSASAGLMELFRYNCGFEYIEEGRTITVEGYVEVADASSLHKSCFYGTGGDTQARRQESQIDDLSTINVTVFDYPHTNKITTTFSNMLSGMVSSGD